MYMTRPVLALSAALFLFGCDDRIESNDDPIPRCVNSDQVSSGSGAGGNGGGGGTGGTMVLDGGPDAN